MVHFSLHAKGTVIMGKGCCLLNLDLRAHLDVSPTGRFILTARAHLDLSTCTKTNTNAHAKRLLHSHAESTTQDLTVCKDRFMRKDCGDLVPFLSVQFRGNLATSLSARNMLMRSRADPKLDDY